MRSRSNRQFLMGSRLKVHETEIRHSRMPRHRLLNSLVGNFVVFDGGFLVVGFARTAKRMRERMFPRNETAHTCSRQMPDNSKVREVREPSLSLSLFLSVARSLAHSPYPVAAVRRAGRLFIRVALVPLTFLVSLFRSTRQDVPLTMYSLERP